MARVLIVGSGLTGSVVKYYLSGWLASLGRQQFVPSITMWESESASGGRMGNDFFVGPHRCDLGAQYISQNIGGGLEDCGIYNFLSHKGSFSLIQNNTIVSGMRPEHLNGQHFIATSGTSDITGSLGGKSDVMFGKKLVRLAYEKETSKLLAYADDNPVLGSAFDAVILTMPTPQLSNVLKHSLSGRSNLLPSSLLERLERVRYSSRLALAAYYQLPSASAKQSVLDSVPWRAKYVMDDDVVRYVSMENFKYEAEGQAPEHDKAQDTDAQHILSILVHTSVPYGLANPDVLKYCSTQSQEDVRDSGGADLEARKQDVIHTILQHLTQPGALPALAAYAPARTRLVGWEQSQVSRGFYSAEVAAGSADTSRGVLSGTLGGDEPPAVLLSTPNQQHTTKDVELNGEVGDGEDAEEDRAVLQVIAQVAQDSAGATTDARNIGPLLVLAGDAFTESNFDGCVKSGRFAARAAEKHLKLAL